MGILDSVTGMGILDSVTGMGILKVHVNSVRGNMDINRYGPFH